MAQETKNGKGKIEELSEKQGRLALKIAGKYYALWAQGEDDNEKAAFLMQAKTELKAGDWIEYTYVEKENPNGGSPYKNLRSLKVIAAPPVAQQHEAGGYNSDRDRNIQKQVAVKTAAEFLKACPHVIDEKAPIDTLLKAARAIDEWLGSSVPMQSHKETLPKPPQRADGAIEAIEEDIG